MNFEIDHIFENLDVNKLDKNTYDKNFLLSLNSKKKIIQLLFMELVEQVKWLCVVLKVYQLKLIILLMMIKKNVEKIILMLKTITPEALANIDKNSYIFISHVFFDKSLGRPFL